MGDAYQLLEGLGVLDGHFCQHLSIDFYVSLLQAVDELAIGEAQLPGGRTDSQYPQPTEVALSFPAMAVGVGPCMNQRLLRPPVATVGGAVVSPGHREDFLVAAALGNAAFYPCHGMVPARWVCLKVMGNQSLNPSDIALGNRHFADILAADSFGLFATQVAAHPLAAHKLSCPCNVEPGFSPLVCLQLGHLLPLRPFYHSF